MQLLVQSLQGKGAVSGKEQHRDEAITICAQILPFLLSCRNTMEREDALLKMAVEGGNYCALGVKRMANELLTTFLQTMRPEDNPKIIGSRLLI